MKYIVHTLIDITETRARFDKSNPEWHQQQNFITLLQTLGLRTNPVIEKQPTLQKQLIKELGLGSSYRGEQNVWTLEFSMEESSAVTIDNLIKDFDLVTIIPGLDETIKLSDPVFVTTSKTRCNLVFKCID